MTELQKITKEEYYNWLKTSDMVGNEYPVFTSCCGIHEFGMELHKNGNLYELFWGWYPEDGNTKYWYGIKELYREGGQEGDRI